MLYEVITNEGLIKAAGVRVLYCYYFGTRNLTANKEIKSPTDLAGVKSYNFV